MMMAGNSQRRESICNEPVRRRPGPLPAMMRGAITLLLLPGAHWQRITLKFDHPDRELGTSLAEQSTILTLGERSSLRLQLFVLCNSDFCGTLGASSTRIRPQNAPTATRAAPSNPKIRLLLLPEVFLVPAGQPAPSTGTPLPTQQRSSIVSLQHPHHSLGGLASFSVEHQYP